MLLLSPCMYWDGYSLKKDSKLEGLYTQTAKDYGQLSGSSRMLTVALLVIGEPFVNQYDTNQIKP
jgi:hypothetical protein